MTGIDPDAAAVEAACRTAPECAVRLALAEALPFPNEHLEGSVFLDSLHHVPPEVMAAALDEAAQVTACGGSVIVIEPLAEGSFFSAFRRIEDETAVRR